MRQWGERVKFAILTSEYPPFRGGVGTYAYELAAAAVSEGHDVTVLAPDYGVDQSVHDTAMPGRTLRYPDGVSNFKGLSKRIRAAWLLFRDNQFDVIHAADWPFFIPVKVTHRWQCRARVLLTVHGSEILFMNKLKRRLILKGLKMLRPGWATWISNSRYTRSLLLETFPEISADQVRCVPLGVSGTWIAGRIDRAAARARFCVAEDVKVIVTLGRIAARKGHAFLADALGSLPADTTRGWQWWVIGPTIDADYVALVKEKATRLAIPSIFFGSLPSAEVQARICAADVFCLPSWTHPTLGMEGFGLAFLEAAAFGVPALGSNAGGIPDAVEDGVSGLLVPERDVPAIADALARMLTDDALRARLGAGAEAKATNATWVSVMRQTYTA